MKRENNYQVNADNRSIYCQVVTLANDAPPSRQLELSRIALDIMRTDLTFTPDQIRQLVPELTH